MKIKIFDNKIIKIRKPSKRDLNKVKEFQNFINSLIAFVFMKNRVEILLRAIIQTKDKILVCKKLGKKYYFFPGGHVSFGESVKKALARELKEEKVLPKALTRAVLKWSKDKKIFWVNEIDKKFLKYD